MDLTLSCYTLLLLVSGLSATPAGQTQTRKRREAETIITMGALEKQALVDAHNFYRAAVSPTATNMIKMEWDDSLQAVATAFARQCVFGSNPDLATLQLGEADYVKPISGPQPTAKQSLEAAVTLWHTRHTDYTYSSNTCAPTRNCGQYRQLVWHNSYKVGCSLVQCATLENLPDFNGGHFIICHYDLAGNLDGQRPYQEGSPCLNCPVSHQSCENNLCIETPSTDPPTAVTNPDKGTGAGDAGQTAIFIGVGAGLGGVLLLFFLILTIWCIVRRRKKGAEQSVTHETNERGRTNAQVHPENHDIHRPGLSPHDDRERVHQDMSGHVPRDRLDTPHFPNRPRPENKYESIKRGSHTYEDIDSALHLDEPVHTYEIPISHTKEDIDSPHYIEVLPDLQI